MTGTRKDEYKPEYDQGDIIFAAQAFGIPLKKEGICGAMAVTLAAEFLASEKGLQEVLNVTEFLAGLLKKSRIDPAYLEEKVQHARNIYKDAVKLKIKEISGLVETFLLQSADSAHQTQLQDLLSRDAWNYLQNGIKNLQVLANKRKTEYKESDENNFAYIKSQISFLIANAAGKTVSAAMAAKSRLHDDNDPHMLLQLSPFFEAIQIIQYTNQETYAHLLSTMNNPVRMDIVKNMLLLAPYNVENSGGVACVDIFSHLHTKETLAGLFSVLGNNLQAARQDTSLVIATDIHAIAVCYRHDGENAGWYLSDPNQLPGEKISLENCTYLAERIFYALHTLLKKPLYNDGNAYLHIQVLAPGEKIENLKETIKQCKETPEWQAIEKNIIENIDLKIGKDSNEKDLFRWAVVDNDMHMVKFFLNESEKNEKVKDLFNADKYGWTPLHFAAMYGCSEIISELIAHYPDINISLKSKNNDTPLYLATRFGHHETVLLLLKKKGKEISPEEKGFLLDTAIQFGKSGVVTLLLEKFPELHARKKPDGSTILHNAVRHNQNEVIHALMEMKEVNRNARNNQDETPLHLAANSGNVEAVIILLNNGAKCDAETSKGRTPLHLAASSGKIEAVNVLLNRDANIEAEDNFGMQPLHLAILEGHKNVIVTLLIHGLSIPNDIMDARSLSPDIFDLLNKYKNGNLLHWVVQQPNGTDLIRMIIEQDKKSVQTLFIPDENGNTPLHIAITKGDNALVKILLKALGEKAAHTLFLPDSQENTPLHLAVAKADIQMVRTFLALLDRMPDPPDLLSQKNSAGQSIVDLAVKSGNTEILDEVKKRVPAPLEQVAPVKSVFGLSFLSIFISRPEAKPKIDTAKNDPEFKI